MPCLPLHSLNNNDLRSKALLNWAHNMGFPKALVAELLASLRSTLLIKSPSRADDKIEKRIMEWYAKIFGHYQVYGDALLSSRTRKRLSMSHPSPDIREFLQWFAETGVLQYFFFTQVILLSYMFLQFVGNNFLVEQSIPRNSRTIGSIS